MRDENIPVGIISLVKRDYLQFFDIGFAFLPRHSKQGFAFEASNGFLQYLVQENFSPKFLATTVKENKNSIALLEKLGFCFEEELTTNGEALFVFSISSDMVQINNLTKSFFNVFTNVNNHKVNLERIFSLCLAEAVIIRKSTTSQEIYNLESFIKPRIEILTNGTLTDFEEREIKSETKVIGEIAQRYSKYEKCGNFNGSFFEQQGDKFFQYVKTQDGWKISAVIWQDEE
jgi:hypothetical protein